VPERLVGDAGRLRQILTNLLGNAVKFTDAGEVVVRVSAQQGEADGDDVLLHVAVRDTGPGIPADRQGELFMPFVQLDGSSTRAHGGTGLGLAISAQLAELMGGRVWVESAVGAGSTFHVNVRCRLGASDGSGALPESEFVRGMRILVVDGSPASRRVLVTPLAQWGASVDSVDFAAAALDAMRSRLRSSDPYVLVVLDGQLPETDGYELARLVRDDAELRNARLIMLTSGATEDERRRCRELDVSALLAKPVRQTDLVRAIETALLDEPGGQPTGPAPQSAPPAGNLPPLRVLVAEDDAVNRTVVVRMLEKRGHKAYIAADGARALEFLGMATFDLVLMDVQMPLISGLQATAAIRLDEERTKRHQPIIAMTAHAMKGDQERCLAAGMDGYVSKPVRGGALFSEIESVLGRARPAGRQTPSGDDGHELVPIDRSDLLDRCGGDETLLKEVIGLFLGSVDEQLASVRLAMETADAARIERVAHGLKGSLTSIAARPAAEAALALERAGHDGRLDIVRALVDDLGARIDVLTPLLRDLTVEACA
jgi:two-component system sensor histidine kinase/response regulator